MASTVSYEEQTEKLLENFAKDNGLEVVDVEFVKEGSNWYLRIYIDKNGGVDILDCEAVSKYIDPILDERNFISQSYILEVSSPGLTRKLKKNRDFKRHIGDYVEFKLFKSIDGYKDFVGELLGFDDETVTIKFEEDDIKVFERKKIASIRLAILF